MIYRAFRAGRKGGVDRAASGEGAEANCVPAGELAEKPSARKCAGKNSDARSR
jgi:hypothetical protein